MSINPLYYDELRQNIEQQELILLADTEKFFNLLARNRFYISEAISSQLTWYVSHLRALANYEKGKKDMQEATKNCIGCATHEELRKATEDTLKKLRFGYAAARRYSLEYAR